MSQEVIELTCPGCGARVSTSMSECEWCHKPVVITTFNSVADMALPEVNKYANTYRKELVNNPDNRVLNKSLAMCYLKLKMYDKASEAFEKAIEDNFDDAEVYFYASVALLKGQKAFVTPRVVIDKIEEYLNVANMIEPKGIYFYFLAYIKYDHHYRKYYNTTPNYQQLLQQAALYGYSEYDVHNLFNLLGVNRPDVL